MQRLWIKKPSLLKTKPQPGHHHVYLPTSTLQWTGVGVLHTKPLKLTSNGTYVNITIIGTWFGACPQQVDNVEMGAKVCHDLQFWHQRLLLTGASRCWGTNQIFNFFLDSSNSVSTRKTIHLLILKTTNHETWAEVSSLLYKFVYLHVIWLTFQHLYCHFHYWLRMTESIRRAFHYLPEGSRTKNATCRTHAHTSTHIEVQAI